MPVGQDHKSGVGPGLTNLFLYAAGAATVIALLLGLYKGGAAINKGGDAIAKQTEMGHLLVSSISIFAEAGPSWAIWKQIRVCIWMRAELTIRCPLRAMGGVPISRRAPYLPVETLKLSDERAFVATPRLPN